MDVLTCDATLSHSQKLLHYIEDNAIGKLLLLGIADEDNSITQNLIVLS